jgi:2-isopropylmalate synthase
VLERIKQLENIGFQYEGAEASFQLLIEEALHGKVSHFKLKSFRVSDEKIHEDEPVLAEATVRIELPDGAEAHTVAQGNGPLNALDLALRKALMPFFPALEAIELHDYKVRVLGAHDGTDAVVRVLIESGDDDSRWNTVGVSSNVIEASWQALVDSIEFKLFRDEKRAHAELADDVKAGELPVG